MQPSSRTFIRLAAALWILAAAPARAEFDAGAVFRGRCAGCHSVGRGDVVGPDLRGVTRRRSPEWLHSFIRSPEAVLRSGDPVAAGLFARYRERMPDHDLAPEEIDALLAYIAAGGPDGQGGGFRPAGRAGVGEAARGRDLFLGRVAFANGGTACVRCHVAGEARVLGGGALASDLTAVFRKYRDRGLDKALRDCDFPLMDRLYAGRPLTPEEVFALRAFLYRTAASGPRPPEPGGPRLALLGLGSALLLWLGARPRG